MKEKVRFAIGIYIILSIIDFEKSVGTQGCNVINCPPLQGFCYSNKCICSKNYLTVNNDYVQNTQGIECNYKSKSKFMAFILEFFFPIGVGHLYAENTTLAIIKFSLFTVFLFAFCTQLCCLKKPIGKCLIVISFLFIIDFVSWFILQITDITGYALGFYKDGNGVPMH